MPLASGVRLGPYEILSALGAGGMGEVYRARDTRLERIVAIKVLPSHVSGDPALRERFEREARTVAALNHPNICTLHDVGHQDGIDFLVMEYVEGETLADRLAKAGGPKGPPLRIDEALGIAVQIADALGKAHRAGIVHRDLKPGNIMLVRRGGPLGPPHAKLLDFGLAKMTPAVVAASDLSIAPTMQTPMTVQGTILGTLQYMAPEQIEGRETDARTDIFAFGAVLYEMLTGRKAFEGNSQASLIAAILEHAPPPIASLQPLAPSALDRIVRRCLAKDPDARWQTASDLASELQWIAEGGSTDTRIGETRTVATSRRGILAWIVAGVFAITSVGLAVARFRPGTPPDAATMRFPVPPPEKAAFFSDWSGPFGSIVALSPDGRRLAFVAGAPGGNRQLWVRPLDGLTSQPLPGTDGATAPFWSPDGQSIAFFSNGKLKRVAAAGGDVQNICDSGSGGGGTWNRDNVILFSPADAGESGLLRVAATGGTPTAVTTLDPAHGETNSLWPHFLPDGNHYLYYLSGRDDSGIYVGALASPSRTRLLETEFSMPAYAAGYMLFVRDRALMAQPFDVDRLQLSGDALRVADAISTNGPGSSAFSTSTNGMLALWSGTVPQQKQLTWVRRDGTPIATVGPPIAYSGLRLAPDERRVAIERSEPTEKNFPNAIWIVDVQRGTSTKLTFEWGTKYPTWSPDGNRIAFVSPRRGPPSVYVTPSSGAGQDDLVFKGITGTDVGDWTPDARAIVTSSVDAKTKWDLWLLPLDGKGARAPLVRTPFNELDGRISPDGRWIAYTSDESGRYEVHVTGFPTPGATSQVSLSGGTLAEWRRDGKELFYRSLDGTLMAVPVKTEPRFEAGTPTALFDIPAAPPDLTFPDTRLYAAGADGQRFLIGALVGESVSPPLTIVLNWAAGLRK